MLESPAGISLDAVAKRAGVTRLTVYNQFGSRRALLEAVFDDVAHRGGLHRIRDAILAPDPHAALRQIVAIFCDFWSFHHALILRLHAAGATDPEFEASLRTRHERRRGVLSVLVGRMAEGGHKPPELLIELTDVLFALTGTAFYGELTAQGYQASDACRIIQALAADTVRRMLSEPE
jgi:AcrR family transcriptional regulator